MAASVASNCLYAHEVQRGNPLLKYIRNVKWEFSADIVPDYVMGSTCALFLSVKFHFRHPTVRVEHYFPSSMFADTDCCRCRTQHISKRIQEVGRNFRLRILLVYVDDESNLAAIQELNKIAFVNDFTLILAWSNAECARYLETFKVFEGKSAASIQEKVETEFMPRLTSILTNIRSVNKTDVTTMMGIFGTFGSICRASEEQLQMCPGLGEKKVKRLHKILHEPFLPERLKKARKSEVVIAGEEIGSAQESKAATESKDGLS